MIMRAMVVAGAMALPGTAQAQAGPAWEWTHPANAHPFCRLSVQQVAQEGPDQPLRFAIRNDTGSRVGYTIAVATHGTAGRQNALLSVDNAHVNEISMAATAPPPRGQVSRIQLTLQRCVRRA